MMEWLREIFWMFQIVMAFQSVIPITVGGVFLALAAPRIANIWLRTITLVGIVAIQALGSLWLFITSNGLRALAWLLPFSFNYPYVNMGSLLFFWLPVIAQLLYVTQKNSPKFWLAGLIGFLGVVAGVLFLMFMGSAVGAATD